MKRILVCCTAVLAAGLLGGCTAGAPAGSSSAPEREEPAASTAETAAVVYHGESTDTPEETLAQTLEAEDPVLCPDCGEVLQGVLVSSEELPVEEQPCRSMVNGTDAVYKLSLTYDWQCAACGYTDPGQTVEGTRAMVCHGWTS